MDSNDRHLVAKAARKLPNNAGAHETLDCIMHGADARMSGADLVFAIRLGVEGIKKIPKTICDCRFNSDWVVFLRGDSGEITWERIYSAAHYAPEFIRRIIAFADTGYRENWKPEVQFGPAEIIASLSE